MKLTKNKYYIISSFIGWILLFFFTLTTLKVYRNLDNKGETNARIQYVIYEGFSCAILAFILSYLVALFIDQYIDFRKVTRIDIIKLALVFISSQIIYSGLLWPLLIYIDQFINSGVFKESDFSMFYIKLYNIPFFATLFFIWFFVYITINIYHQLKRVQLKQYKLEANLKESQLNTLKGQINPHFMFNSLNNIRGLILEDTRKSREMITRLSDMLRYSLTKNDVDAIALEDELEMVDNYVAISKIQMEERLQFEKNILVNTLGIKIPPMIIQMLVENAAKHGIANSKKGGVITLNIKQEGKQLLIEVCNSGKLLISTESTQLGLKNIKQRLSLLYKGAAYFNLEEKSNQVVATIQIPLS